MHLWYCLGAIQWCTCCSCCWYLRRSQIRPKRHGCGTIWGHCSWCFGWGAVDQRGDHGVLCEVSNREDSAGLQADRDLDLGIDWFIGEMDCGIVGVKGWQGTLEERRQPYCLIGYLHLCLIIPNHWNKLDRNKLYAIPCVKHIFPNDIPSYW